MKIKVSENLTNFAKLLGKKAELYIVGGYVRNSILGISNTEVDLASKLTVDQLKKLTKNTCYEVKEKNKVLSTAQISCKGETWDYATFRRERYAAGKGDHMPEKVVFITDVREDAKRRDFTINSIYYNILKDEIIDIYSGLYDIRKKRIRTIETPDYVFENDGVRILRMVRQACELDFKIHRETYLKAKQMVYRLKDVSVTRKHCELTKILNSPNKFPSSKEKSGIRGLNLFNQMGIWGTVFAGVTKINYKMVKKVSQENKFIGLMIDLVKTLDPDSISYYLEYTLGKDGLKLAKSKRKDIIAIVSGYFEALGGLDNKMYFYNYFDYFEKIAPILQKKSIMKHSKYNFYFKYIKKYKIPISLKDLNISGKDLKENFPSIAEKKYNAVLFDMFNMVFDGEVENSKEKLLKEVEKIYVNWYSFGCFGFN